MVVGVPDGIGDVLRAATAYHPSTLKTMCAMIARRCTSCEHEHASIALTASTVCLLRSITMGTVGRRRRLLAPLIPEVVQKVEGWGNSCFMNPRACVRQLHCESFVSWPPPGPTKFAGFLAGVSEEGAVCLMFLIPGILPSSNVPGERAKLDDMSSQLLLLPKLGASLRVISFSSASPRSISASTVHELSDE